MNNIDVWMKIVDKKAYIFTVFEIFREYLLPLISCYVYFIGATMLFYITLAIIIPVFLVRAYKLIQGSLFDYALFSFAFIYYSFCYNVWVAFSLKLLCLATIKFILGYIKRFKNDFFSCATAILLIALSIYGIRDGNEKLLNIIGCLDAWYILNYPLDKSPKKILVNFACGVVIFTILYFTDHASMFTKSMMNCTITTFIAMLSLDQIYDVLYPIWHSHFAKQLEIIDDINITQTIEYH